MMEHVLIENDDLDLTPEQLRRRQENKTRKYWCLFISISAVIVAGVCLGVWYVTHMNDADKSNNAVDMEGLMLESTQMCDTCGMLPNFDKYCIGRTCRFSKWDDKTISCPSGYGDVQFYKVKYGSHHTAEGLVMLQNECSERMLETSGVCTLNVAELLGDEPFVYDGGVIEEDTGVSDTGAESAEGEGETAELMLTHTDPDSVKAYYICNKVDATENMLMKALTPDADMEENYPFLSVAMVKCGTTVWKANYLDGGKTCDKTGSFTLTCDAERSDPRILVVKVSPKDKGANPTDPAAKKARKKAGKRLAAKANDMCGEQGGSSCSFELSDIFEEGADITAGKWKVSYLCSYGDSMEAAEEPTEPLMLGSPYEMEEETYPILTAVRLACEATKPVGQYVENGKSCSSTDIVLQCDASRDPRIIIAKFNPEIFGPKETDPVIKAQNKASGKERTLNANNFCGNSDNINPVEGDPDFVACTFNPLDLLAESDEFEADQSFNVKYFCLYDSAVIV